MKLYLVRHAIAEDRSPLVDDARRPLTERGRKRFARSVRGLARVERRFERVFTSPLLRAQETADLLADHVAGEIEVTPYLATTPSDELLETLRACGANRVALVGHEPYLSDLVAWLVFGWRIWGESSGATVCELKKGGIAVLEGDLAPGAMTLLALHPPAALRALARR